MKRSQDSEARRVVIASRLAELELTIHPLKEELWLKQRLIAILEAERADYLLEQAKLDRE